MERIRKRDIPESATFLRFRTGYNGDVPKGERVYQSPMIREQYLSQNPDIKNEPKNEVESDDFDSIVGTEKSNISEQTRTILVKDEETGFYAPMIPNIK